MQVVGRIVEVGGPGGQTHLGEWTKGADDAVGRLGHQTLERASFGHQSSAAGRLYSSIQWLPAWPYILSARALPPAHLFSAPL